MIGFFVGVFLSGTVLALVFGALHLEAEEKVYWKGYTDGLNRVHEEEVNETDIY